MRALWIPALVAFAIVGPRDAPAVELGGVVDYVVTDSDLRSLNAPRTADSYFDPFHVRLLAEGGSEDTRVFLQWLMVDTAVDPIRLFGAYVLHRPWEQREFYVQLGRIPTPQGSFGPRVYADKNPLVGIPFGYFRQTSMPTSQMPHDLQELVDNRGRAPWTVRYEDAGELRGERGSGVLLLYDNCWHDGVSLLGVEKGIEYQFAVTPGAPGAPINGLDDNDQLALHARLGYAPLPELVLRLSWGRGAYLSRAVQSYLPAGRSVNDYAQTLWIGSAELATGHFVFHSEVFLHHLDTPLREDGLASWSAYAEGSWRFRPGWNVALRYDTMRYEEVDTADGPMPWDLNVSRWEGGLRYSLSRNTHLKAVVQATDLGDGFTSDLVQPAVQAVLRF